MLERLWRFFKIPAESAPIYADYEPVYGLPRRAVEEWLARNPPQLRQQYEIEEWLARNPPLRQEYEAAVRQTKVALRVEDGDPQDKTSPRRRDGDSLSRSTDRTSPPPGA